MKKQLGIDVQHDCADAFGGKLWTFVAISDGTLGVAVANEKGYSPVPAFHYKVDRYDEAEAEADRLNEAMHGQTHRASSDIVLTTMSFGS